MKTFCLVFLCFCHSVFGQTVLKNAKLQNAKIGQSGVSAPAGGTFTFLTHSVGSASGSGLATTTAADTTGAKLIDLVVVSVAAVTVVDLKGNTLTADTASTIGGFIVQHYYVCNPASVGSGHQFTAQGVNAFPMIAMECFSYTGTTPQIDGTSVGNTVATGTTIQAGSISSTGGGRVVISGIVSQNTGDTYSIDSSLSITDSGKSAFGNIGIGMAHLEQASGSAINPQWTISVAENNIAARNIAFK